MNEKQNKDVKMEIENVFPNTTVTEKEICPKALIVEQKTGS